jgi:hypothetical protein
VFFDSGYADVITAPAGASGASAPAAGALGNGAGGASAPAVTVAPSVELAVGSGGAGGVDPVPEPGTIALLAAGALCGVMFWLRRGNRAA